MACFLLPLDYSKADVVNLLQQAVADGANLIQQQRNAGLDKTTKFPGGPQFLLLDVRHRAQWRALRPACVLLSRQSVKRQQHCMRTERE